MTVRAGQAVPNTMLRSLRMERAWSLQDVADALARLGAEEGRHVQVSAETVGRWERGNIRRPDPINLRLLARLFDATVSGLGYGVVADAELQRLAPDAPTTAVETSNAEWLAVRRSLKERRNDLTRRALRLYSPEQRIDATGLLAPGTWLPAQPLPLSAIGLRWDDSLKPQVSGGEEEARSVRPLQTPTRHYDRYHRAVRDLDRPRLYENRLCYRLVAADLRSAQPTMTFGNMCYFDMIDVGEAAAHELADRSGGGRQPVGWDDLRFRRLIQDPFEIAAYPLLLSISTLTIRRGRSGSSFLLLERDAKKVAIAGGMLSVLPTGVFQPASILPVQERTDFDLWCNTMREYSEEFLGNPEHDGNGSPIDYENTEPFRSLNRAHEAGDVRTYCLGIGIDSLNLVGDVVSVAVFEADVFDTLFRERVSDNDEGSVSNGGATQFYDFNEATVQRLLRSAPLAPSGAACLDLAWQHRGHLLDIA